MQLTHAAEDHHHQHGARLVPGQDIRIDETELARSEITGQSCQRAGQHEGAELVDERPDSPMERMRLRSP